MFKNDPRGKKNKTKKTSSHAAVDEAHYLCLLLIEASMNLLKSRSAVMLLFHHCTRMALTDRQLMEYYEPNTPTPSKA